MKNLNSIEIKAFIPAKDFELSKQFYIDIGFNLASDTAGIAYFHHGNSSFLLQDFYIETHAQNFMMHLLVEDVASWHQQLTKSGIASKYDVKITEIETQPWGMKDFVLFDPTGVVWRIAENN